MLKSSDFMTNIGVH